MKKFQLIFTDNSNLLFSLIFLFYGFTFRCQTPKLQNKIIINDTISNISNPLAATTCVVNGVTITASGSGFTNFPNQINTYSNCNPNAIYAGSGVRSDPFNFGSIIYTFSQPITSANIGYSIFDRYVDSGYISINGCGTLTLSNPCGLTVSGGNIITGAISSNNGLSSSGNVTITVSSNKPFTTITFTDDPNSATFISQSNLCSFSLVPYVCNLPVPILSSNSLSNVCPANNIDLSTITTSNSPFDSSCGSLTWHTANPATAGNTVSSTVISVSGTYYASFYDPISNCYSPTTAVVVTINGCTTDIKVLKTINNTTPSVGSNVTFTITATNLGPSNSTNTVVNDILPNGYTLVSVTPSVGSWTAPNWTIGSLANGENATLTVVATVKATGNYTNTATISANQTDTVTANNTSSVTPSVLYAVADNFSSTPINSCSGGVTASVLTNDTLNSTFVTNSQVTTSIVNAGGLTGVTINNLGVISVGTGNATGTYTVTYRICQTATGFTSNCSQSTAVINISNTPLVAVNDSFVATPINTLTGGSTATVFTNDTLNGVTVTSTSVLASIVSVTPLIPQLTTISNSGIITIPPGTTIGTYTIVYMITQNGCPSNFTTATATINVTEQTIITPTITPGIRANNIVSLVDTQSTGKIIIAGYFSAYNNVTGYNITRLNTDLTLDTSSPQFVTTGSIPANFSPFDMKIIRNTGANYNKILLVGMFDGYNGGTNGHAIARLNVDGGNDSGFNIGQLLTPTSIRGVSGRNATIYSCYVIPDGAIANAGKILIGGSFTQYNGYPANSIAMLNADGTYDTTNPFNTNVNTIIDPNSANLLLGFNSAPAAFEVQPNGKIIVAGYFTWYNGVNKVGILRLNSNGTLDQNFNHYQGLNPGFSTISSDPSSPKNGNNISKMVLQPDGKIILGGYFTHYNGSSCNNIVRLNNDGSIDGQNDGLLDNTFNIGTGFNNTVVHPVTGTNGLVRSLVLDTNNANFWYVYVGGDFTAYNGTPCDEIVRLFCKSPTASDVGTNNTVGFGLKGGGTNGTVWSMKRQGDGKIIIGGQFTTYNGLPALNVSRIFPAPLSNEAKNGTIYYDSEPEIDLFASSDVILFPNPSTGIINFKTEAFKDSPYTVKVYNALGQKVFETLHSEAKETSLNLSDLKKGTYFVTFTSETKIVTKTVILH
jgi:uncharacterized delta-60 repeat protein